MKNFLLKVFDFGPGTCIIPYSEAEQKQAFLELCPQGKHPWEDRDTFYRKAEEKGWAVYIRIERL